MLNCKFCLKRMLPITRSAFSPNICLICFGKWYEKFGQIN